MSVGVALSPSSMFRPCLQHACTGAAAGLAAGPSRFVPLPGTPSLLVHQPRTDACVMVGVCGGSGSPAEPGCGPGLGPAPSASIWIVSSPFSSSRTFFFFKRAGQHPGSGGGAWQGRDISWTQGGPGGQSGHELVPLEHGLGDGSAPRPAPLLLKHGAPSAVWGAGGGEPKALLPRCPASGPWPTLSCCALEARALKRGLCQCAAPRPVPEATVALGGRPRTLSSTLLLPALHLGGGHKPSWPRSTHI